MFTVHYSKLRLYKRNRVKKLKKERTVISEKAKFSCIFYTHPYIIVLRNNRKQNKRNLRDVYFNAL